MIGFIIVCSWLERKCCYYCFFSFFLLYFGSETWNKTSVKGKTRSLVGIDTPRLNDEKACMVHQSSWWCFLFLLYLPFHGKLRLSSWSQAPTVGLSSKCPIYLVHFHIILYKYSIFVERTNRIDNQYKQKADIYSFYFKIEVCSMRAFLTPSLLSAFSCDWCLRDGIICACAHPKFSQSGRIFTH